MGESDAKTSALPPAEALDLGGLIDVAEGSVVSRQLAKTPAGNLTLFAFDAGEGLSEHTAPFDAIVHVLEGVVTLAIGDRSVSASAGQVVVMPAHVPHALQAVTPIKMLLTMFRSG